MKKCRRRRWADGERNFGPFTFAHDKFSKLGLILDTGDLEDNSAALRLHLAGRSLLLHLPTWLPLGRQYGAKVFDDYVHFHYGRFGLSNDTQSKLWAIPWANWRQVRHSVYGIFGELFATETKGGDYLAWYSTCKRCPSVTFKFRDFDGEEICAKTHIEEREWRLGVGVWRWVFAWRKPKVRRYLEIQFSAETGPRKGSWKGGTLGHSIQMLPGEMHSRAFQRYCVEHNMVYVDEVSPR